jgi:hypothetical protein
MRYLLWVKLTGNILGSLTGKNASMPDIPGGPELAEKTESAMLKYDFIFTGR